MVISNDQLDQLSLDSSVIDTVDLAGVQGGTLDGPVGGGAKSTAKPHKVAPEHSTEGGSICRDEYTALGAGIGALLTPEAGGLGSVPGTVIGGIVGRKLCQP